MARAWTTADEAYLIENAGKKPAREIQFELKRSYKAIQHKAKKLGLSLRCPEWKLVWCTECASWRTYINEQTGRCRVCQIKANIEKEEERCAEVMQCMTLQQRRIYEESESKRERRKSVPKMPKLIPPANPSYYSEVMTKQRHYRALEHWKLSILQHEYDACRTRLKRMREAIGENPRKK